MATPRVLPMAGVKAAPVCRSTVAGRRYATPAGRGKHAVCRAETITHEDYVAYDGEQGKRRDAFPFCDETPFLQDEPLSCVRRLVV